MRHKCTPARRQGILSMVEAGNYVEVACAAEGVDEKSYYNWIREGKAALERLEILSVDHESIENEDDSLWPNDFTDYERATFLFFRGARKAQARSEAYAVAIIRKHMPDQWTAAMTYLERRYPARWKRRDLHEVAAAESDRDKELEQKLLEDPVAVAQIHEALARVRELPPGD